VIKYLKGRNGPTNYLEGDINVDSDCEGESTGISDETSKTREKMEDEIRAVLITGSFSACVRCPAPSSRREK
jgi:hypothetical protein